MEYFTDHMLGLVLLYLSIFIVLTIHELGHYICARIFNVHVKEFNLGYGKILWSRTINKTKWCVRSFPIAAHVSLKRKEFDNIEPYKKALVIISGPTVNLVLAFSLFFLFFFSFGQPSTPPVFAAIEINHAADKAGLLPGDRILKANGKQISRYEEVLNLTYLLPIEPVVFEIQRGQKILEINITPEEMSYVDIRGMIKKHGRLGVIARHIPYKLSAIQSINDTEVPEDNLNYARKLVLEHLDKEVILSLRSTDGKPHQYKGFLDKDLNQNLLSNDNEDNEKFTIGKIGNNFYQKLNFLNAAYAALNQTKFLIATIATVPFQLFPLDKENLSPTTLVASDGFNWIGGLYKFLFLTSLISIVVALVNLIPIPQFDGGRLLILALERLLPFEITKKQIAFTTMGILLVLYALVAIVNYENFSAYASHVIQ